MDDQKEETRLIGPGNFANALGEGQTNNSIISFPSHRALNRRMWFGPRCREWRQERFLRPDAITPLPFDLMDEARNG